MIKTPLQPVPEPDAFETWIFDLDNTLYPSDSNLLGEVVGRMTEYVAEHLGIDHERACEVRHALFTTYGTTLRGLMTEHGVDPGGFLEYVHDIDFSAVAADEPLARALDRLPGRKVVFTNASLDYAEKVIERIGLAGHFDGVFDVIAAGYVPKPAPETYRKMLAHFEIDPTSAVMFEDIAKNLVPASALGMTTVWVPTSNDWAREHTENGHIDYTVENLTDWLFALAGMV